MANNPIGALLQARHNRRKPTKRWLIVFVAAIFGIGVAGFQQSCEWFDLWFVAAGGLALLAPWSELNAFLPVYIAPDSYFPLQPKQLLDGFALRSGWRFLRFAAGPLALSLGTERLTSGAGLLPSLLLAALSAVALPLASAWFTYAIVTVFTRSREFLWASLLLPLPLLFLNSALLLPIILTTPKDQFTIVNFSAALWVAEGLVLIVVLARSAARKPPFLLFRTKAATTRIRTSRWLQSNYVYLRETARRNNKQRFRSLYVIAYWLLLIFIASVGALEHQKRHVALGILCLLQMINVILIYGGVTLRLAKEQEANHWDALVTTGLDAKTYVDGIALSVGLPRYLETGAPALLALGFVTYRANYVLAVAMLMVTALAPLLLAYRFVLARIRKERRGYGLLTLWLGAACYYAMILFKYDPTPALPVLALTAIFDAFSIWRMRAGLPTRLPMHTELPLNRPGAHVVDKYRASRNHGAGV